MLRWQSGRRIQINDVNISGIPVNHEFLNLFKWIKSWILVIGDELANKFFLQGYIEKLHKKFFLFGGNLKEV